MQPQRRAVVRRVNAGDAVLHQLLDLARHDHAAAAAIHLDVLAAVLAQQINDVFEELGVSPLVRGDGNGLGVFLQGGVDDLGGRAVVAKVHHLGAGGLQDAAHDVDRRVVAVEQGGGGDQADLVPGLVGLGLLEGGGAGHGALLLKGRLHGAGGLRDGGQRASLGDGQPLADARIACDG